MSQPNIPNITPIIDVATLDVINIILASIGLEELALAHLLNAEAEKIQYALGTLETTIPLPTTGLTFDQILALNNSLNKFILAVSHKELVLLNKLEETIELLEELEDDNGPSLDCECQATFQVFSVPSVGVFTGMTGQPTAQGLSFITGSICPNCILVDEINFIYTFTEDPIVAPNQSLQLLPTSFNPTACATTPTGTVFTVEGEGTILINAIGQSFNVNFVINVTGNNVGPDVFSLTATNPVPGQLFQSYTTTFTLPENSFTISQCSNG
jgi:hypothetical protein